MSKNSSEWMNGNFAKFGLANDLFKIIDTSIAVSARNTFTKSNAEKSDADDDGLVIGDENEDFNQRTPDLNENFAGGEPVSLEEPGTPTILQRPHRLALCLDFGYVTVTSLHPRLDRRPVPFIKKGSEPPLSPDDDAKTEIGRGAQEDPDDQDLASDPVLDPDVYSEPAFGLLGEEGDEVNYEYIGAVGKLSDIFHISISEGAFLDSDGGPLEPPTTTLGERKKTFNDLFGRSPSDPERGAGLAFGRLELRGNTHFYMDDKFSAPLLFTEFPPPGVWEESEVDPGRANRVSWLRPDQDDPEKVEIESPELFGPTGKRINGEWFVGDFRLHPIYRAFVPVVTLLPGTCDLTNDDIIASSSYKPGEPDIDGRVEFFEDGDLTSGCSVFGTHGGDECTIDAGCPYISCGEIGKAEVQERFQILADRINCALGEIDKIYCLIACLQGSIRKAKLATGGDPKVSTSCCDSFTP